MLRRLKGFASKRTQSGFTLVELMIVVAIIGLLASVAIPNFKQYQAKTKTSEAKLQLAAIYSAETAFAGDFDTYATCLISMGYNPQNEFTSRYFATGFAADNTTVAAIAVSNGATCATGAAGTSGYSAGKQVGGSTGTYANLTGTATQATIPDNGAAFKAGAIGPIDSATANLAAASQSRWYINESKTISNPVRGY